jgi:hypothetical protein
MNPNVHRAPCRTDKGLCVACALNVGGMLDGLGALVGAKDGDARHSVSPREATAL